MDIIDLLNMPRNWKKKLYSLRLSFIWLLEHKELKKVIIFIVRIWYCMIHLRFVLFKKDFMLFIYTFSIDFLNILTINGSGKTLWFLV